MTKFVAFIALLMWNFAITISQNYQDVWPSLSKVSPSTAPVVQAATVQELIGRILPDRQHEIEISVDPLLSESGRDTFHLLKRPGQAAVKVSGNSGVAAAAGLNYYIKYFCKCQLNWEAKSQMILPQELPLVDLKVVSPDKFRYYQNVCTLGYSFVWWGWAQWEKHLDWMALNGINLPLAFLGQEAIWLKVWHNLGMNATEIDQHFTGPAFLPWGRMGNIRGWGGTLPSSWHPQTLDLQRRVLDRMRSFGMTPVLPAFAGFVPRAITRIFPKANVTKMEQWNHFEDKFCCPYMLQPDDPLFQRIGSLFMKEMIQEFGTDHIYNCDTFNEMNPKFGDENYLQSVGFATFSAMTAVDPDAIWMLQGWLFLHNDFWTKERAKAYLTSIPLGRMLVLDLQSELYEQFSRLDSYFGQPFIWCMLHNFGGTLGLYGAPELVNQGVSKARKVANITMVGTGITPEGINQNYVMYDLMLEMGWRDQPVNLTNWIEQYSVRRYGSENEHASSAWQFLLKSVYSFNDTSHKIRGKYIISRRPSLKLLPVIWYSPTDLAKAWDSLVSAADKISTGPFRHDLVDVSRGGLQVLGAYFYSQMVQAYKKNSTADLRENGALMLEIFLDMEDLLSTSDDFLLGNWLRDARSWGRNSQESDIYEWNARNQITIWGPSGEILDYANKQWAGVVSNYFKPRWQLFITTLISCLEGHTVFDQKAFNLQVLNSVEIPFTLDKSKFATETKGDTLTVVQKIYQKWRPHLKRKSAKHFERRLRRRSAQLTSMVRS